MGKDIPSVKKKKKTFSGEDLNYLIWSQGSGEVAEGVEHCMASVRP
jgi:hypothetical protein